MAKQFDVVALGELLIDFTENGISEQGNPVMEANPGGAPCNVLAMLGRLSYKTGFIGKVGDDMFGRQLKDAIVEVGISTEGLIMDKEVHTTLAFVHTFEDGDRDFSFYRNPGADMMLTEDDLDEEMIRGCRIFHYGSLSMTAEGCYEATKKAIAIAKESGAVISFDPNLREPLWDSLDNAKEKIAYGISECDVLKIADNEIEWFTGEKDYTKGVEVLKENYPNLKLVLVSLGKEGSMAFTDSSCVTIAPFIQEDTIETTGAGDTFCACVLHYILKNGLKDYNEGELSEMLTYANAAASIVTTRRGALRVMPCDEEIVSLINNYQK